MLQRATLLAFSILLLPGHQAHAARKYQAGTARKEIAVAAASNLTQVFEVVAGQFEKETGIHAVITFGSTASLARQIENGAPWDVFAAADLNHIEQLNRKGLLTPGSSSIYATGILALWIPSPSTTVTRLEDLTNPSVRVIAIAKPELAPYGLASVQALQHAGIWKAVEPKMVYAENIGMAKQYGVTGNADAVFTAYALVKSDSAGLVLQIPDSLHEPLRQALGIAAASKNQALARQFTEFLLTGKGHQIMLQNGYR